MVAAVLSTSALVSTPALHARAQDRIGQRIDDSRVAQTRGNVHPLAQARYDRGRLSPTMMLPRVVMHFTRTAAQQAELDTLLQSQQDPASPNYHKWVTPEQFADRFGISAHDLAQVTSWLESRGFTVVETARSRSYVAFSGPVGEVDSVFRTEMRRYSVEGEEHFANAAEPVVPEALSGVVLGFRGLNDFKPRAHGIIARPQLTSYITGNHFMAPDDFATIYDIQPLRKTGTDGTGVKIAVIGQTDILVSDIQTFRRNAGLMASDPEVILVPGSADPGVLATDLSEADLDIEWSGAVAPGATIVYVNSGNGAFDSLFYAVDQNLAPVLSSSYGNCEKNFTAAQLNSMTAAGQQANAQGITVTSASGDTGAADCDTGSSATATHGLSVDVPAVLPTTTGIGGTAFNDGSATFGTAYWGAANDLFNGSALSYIPEVAWNDAGVQGASGGGAAINFAKPAWQTGTGVPNDGKRDVPDVSFAASPGPLEAYIICSQGSCVDGFRKSDTSFNLVGGTSAGAPAFAGVVALINQVTGSAQGNVNPRLYQLAAISTDAFHDITSGNNFVSCQTGTPNCTTGTMGFSAGTGYDQVTGLGSVDVYKLVTEWVPVSITPNPVAFGNHLPNTSTTLPLTLRNNNSAVLNISGLAISGGFSQTNNCPGALSFGASCTIEVTFVPASAGAQNGTLTITADDSPNPHVVPLSGTFTDLPIALTRTLRVVRSDTNTAPATGMAQPAATSTTASGTTSSTARTATRETSARPLLVSITRTAASDAFTVTNRQSVPLSIAIEVPSGFQQENDCGEELKAGASCAIQLKRERAGAAGELKITSAEGTASVRIGGSGQ